LLHPLELPAPLHDWITKHVAIENETHALEIIIWGNRMVLIAVAQTNPKNTFSVMNRFRLFRCLHISSDFISSFTARSPRVGEKQALYVTNIDQKGIKAMIFI
jgi:hypothetical protein